MTKVITYSNSSSITVLLKYLHSSNYVRNVPSTTYELDTCRNNIRSFYRYVRD